MPKKEKQCCPHCGAAMNEHTHALSKALVGALRKLKARGKETNLKVLGLTRNEWDNFQKLRYWGLVYQVSVNGRRQNGVWWLTQKGGRFLRGEISVPKQVITYRGKRVRYEGDEVSVSDVLPAMYKQRPEYEADAQGHVVERELADPTDRESVSLGGSSPPVPTN
jgi:hypothetical protein